MGKGRIDCAFPEQAKKKGIVFAVILGFVTIISSLYYVYGTPPLTRESGGQIGATMIAGLSEVISFGFHVDNKGIAPVIVESVKAPVRAGYLEIVGIVFLLDNRETVGVLRGTAQENGINVSPVAGHTIQAGHRAELSVAFKALAIGDNTIATFLFSYSYLGLRYSFTYDSVFEGFTVTVLA